jgi:hypothetical protein
VILERGFSGEAACVELGEREIFRSEALPPDLMKGFSAEVEAPLDAGVEPEPDPPRVVVSLPARGLRLEVPLPSRDADLWVVVRLTPRGLVSEIDTHPRGYM